MFCKQGIITQSRSILHPSFSSFRRIHTYISLRILEIGIEVNQIVCIGSNQESYFVGTSNRQFTVLITQSTTLVGSLDTHYILHVVVVQTSLVYQSVSTVCFHLAFRNRIRHIAEHQILLARFVSLEAYHHHILRIRHEIIAFICNTIFLELNHRQSRIQRKNTLIFRHAYSAQTCFHIEFTHSGKVTETERLFSPRFICYLTIEILACKISSLLFIAINKRLTDFIKHMSRLLVHIPIIISTTRCIRTASPQSLFIESNAFSLYRTHNVGTKATITDRK